MALLDDPQQVLDKGRKRPGLVVLLLLLIGFGLLFKSSIEQAGQNLANYLFPVPSSAPASTGSTPSPAPAVVPAATETKTPVPEPPPVAKPISLKIDMVKGGTPVSGRENDKVGENQSGVVTSITLHMQGAPPGLKLRIEVFGMASTGRTNGDGPIMTAQWSSDADATTPPTFPMGMRAIKLRLAGEKADLYDINYRVRLTSGAENSGINGSVAGDQTEKTDSLQHQLIWLTASIDPKS